MLENRPKLQEHLKLFHPEKCYLCLYDPGFDTDKHDCVSRLLLPGPNDVGCQYSTNPMILNIVGGGRPVGCHICGELFPQELKLKHHTNQCHSISTTDANSQ